MPQLASLGYVPLNERLAFDTGKIDGAAENPGSSEFYMLIGIVRVVLSFLGIECSKQPRLEPHADAPP